MNIRKVRVEDFDDILNIQLQLEDVETQFDSNLKERCYETMRGKEKLKNRIHNEHNIFYVVTNANDKVIAFVDGTISDDEWWYKEPVVYLNHICVDESYRNQGIAKMLLKKFEDTAREKGAKYVRLLTFSKNKVAISCYQNYGFSEYSIYYHKKIES